MLPCIGLSSDRSAVTGGNGPIASQQPKKKRDRHNGRSPQSIACLAFGNKLWVKARQNSMSASRLLYP